jgi:hypothetical protein
MEINLDNENKIKAKQLSEEKQMDDYEKFYKKEELKVSLINIDSMFRNKSPKNIYSSSINYLPKDPLTFTQDYQFVEVTYPNHGFVENDRIIIQNVEGKSCILSAGIYLFQNYSYCFININHDFTTNYINLLNKLQVEIIFLDVVTTKKNISVFHKNAETVVIRLRGVIVTNGKKGKPVVVEESSSEISMSTLLIDYGGKFNQTSLSNALKKSCEQLILKLTE